MSVVPQVRDLASSTIPTADPEMRVAAPVPGRDNALSLLREAITRLNSSSGELPDQAQMADLLAEVQEALDRANMIARAAAQCEDLLREAQFEKALQILDATLIAYPGDAGLVARRSDVDARQKAFQSAATVRSALEEAQWLLDQNRLDLAAHFLKEKALEWPEQPALQGRLKELEALLPQWEQDRQFQAALARVASLEELQQWQVALTTVEEALQSFSASKELTGAARRVRDRLAEQERQNRLARRLELIGQKIAAGSWKPALALLESTETEFPGAPELKPLRREVDAGRKRSECEAIVTEVRQCLADGEPEHAERVLRRGMESLGKDSALEALRLELESERNYREELRTAQILFGRRQLPEAERVLAGLASQNRAEVQTLLDAVRKARALTDEENFCERGREKALKLMQQQQFAQAADLLRNLHSLFPGDPILGRDLLAAEAALQGSPAEAAAEEKEEESKPPAPDTMTPPPAFSALRLKPEASAPNGLTVRVRISPRARKAVITGAVSLTASLLLVSAGSLAWNLSHQPAPVIKLAVLTPPVIPTLDVKLDPLPEEGGSPGTTSAIGTSKTAPPQPATHPAAPPAVMPPVKGTTQPEAAPLRAVRPFVAPATKQAPVQVQNSAVPLPPDTAAVISAEMLAGLPADLTGPNALAPPPSAAPRSVAPVAAAAPKPPAATSTLQQAQLLERTLPTYPDIARQRGIFGSVQIEATIDEKGTVRNVKVLRGDPILGEAAKNAVEKWKYKAATLNGQPIPTTRTIQVSFANAK